MPKIVVTKKFAYKLDIVPSADILVVSMYVATRKRNYKGKVYSSSQIVEGYRTPEGKVRQKILADISKLGPQKIAAVQAALQGTTVVDWEAIGLVGQDFGLGYVASKTLKNLGFPAVLGDDGKKHFATIAGMIVNRLDDPCAKYSLSNWAKNTSLSDILETSENAFSHKACYKALDFLADNQKEIEDRLFERRDKAPKLFFYDITSTYFEGRCADQAAFGYSRDKRGDRKQIVIGLVADDQGLPITVEVFDGNTRDASTVKGKIDEIRNRFGVKDACFVGDRGMRTKANIEEIRSAGLDFILALTHREVLALVEKHGPVQMGLFDKKEIAEVVVDGHRLIVCHNPIAGADTKRRRDELIELTVSGLEKIKARVKSGRLVKPDAIRHLCDKIFFKLKTEKFILLDIKEGSFDFTLGTNTITAAERLDGVYVIETTLGADESAPEEIQTSYKMLSVVERAFRITKSELEIRPVFHYKNSRVKGHVFLCFLAYLVERSLKAALESLPKDERPEHSEVIGALRGWHRVKVPGQPQLKPKFSGFAPEIAMWLNLWHITPPT